MKKIEMTENNGALEEEISFHETKEILHHLLVVEVIFAQIFGVFLRDHFFLWCSQILVSITFK